MNGPLKHAKLAQHPALRAYTMTIVAMLLALPLNAAIAETFPIGHGALENFRTPLDSPTPVRIWLVALVGVFLCSLAFIKNHPLARWAALCFLLSAITGHALFAMLGLPFLGGSVAIMHLLWWTPVLLVALVTRPFLNTAETPLYRFWSLSLVLVILISFYFDISSAVTYIDHFRTT